MNVEQFGPALEALRKEIAQLRSDVADLQLAVEIVQ